MERIRRGYKEDYDAILFLYAFLKKRLLLNGCFFENRRYKLVMEEEEERRSEEFELGRATGLVDHTDKKEIVIYTSPGRQRGQ